MRIQDTLNRLDKTIGDGAAYGAVFCHFNNPVNAEKIKSFEERNGIRLPESFKAFLEFTNGGMIVTREIHDIIRRDGDLETAKWNSTYLLSLEEIQEAYDSMKGRNFGVAGSFGMTYPFIPFCTTKTNEYLIFINLSKEETESVVLDAFHEESPDTWGVVADNFGDFLEVYIDTNGDPDVLGDENNGVATDYIDLPEDDEKDESPQEIIEHTSREIKTDPENHWAMIRRGIAYIDMGNFPAALEDMNKAIDLKADDAYYYFTRGDLYQKAGKIRAALIDYDIAVKLKPDDTLYLACRSGVLWQMEKYDLALADANLAIEINDKDILAYMMRESIYRSLGENEKADMDSRKIDDLKEAGY